MLSARKFAIACLWLGGLLAAAGCGSKGQSEPDAKTAAINGSNAASADPGGAARETKAPKPPSNPVVSIQTSLGEIVVELDAQTAPITTAEFLDYAKRRHYDRTIVHQAIKNYAIVGGQYEQDLTKRPPRTPIPNEAARCRLKNRRGTIAMMRDPEIRDSGTCQFFINVADNPRLDHEDAKSDLKFGYCAFGKVLEGLDVVDKIAAVAVKNEVKDGRPFEQVPVEPVIIQKVSLVR
jgi:cyclophilin family peptidyl-prolyl cis-trans isomerase